LTKNVNLENFKIDKKWKFRKFLENFKIDKKWKFVNFHEYIKILIFC